MEELKNASALIAEAESKLKTFFTEKQEFSKEEVKELINISNQANWLKTLSEQMAD